MLQVLQLLEVESNSTIGGTGVYNYNASGSVGSFMLHYQVHRYTISALNAFISDDKTILLAVKGDPTATVTIHDTKKKILHGSKKQVLILLVK